MSEIKKNHFKFIYLEITKKCNLQCSFCPSRHFQKNDEMSLDDFTEVLSSIKNYTNTIYLHVLGEPLLHSHFDKIVEIAYQKGFKVRLTTNGTLLDKNIISKLPLNKINISLQSLINLKSQEIDDYFDNLYQLILDLKPKLEQGNLGIDLRMWNDKNENEMLNRQIITNINKYNLLNLTKGVRLSIEESFIWPDEELSINEKKFQCLGGKTHLAILCNGDVCLCCLDYQGKTKLGNIFQQSLDEILADSMYQDAMHKMQARNPYFKLCQTCRYRNRF